MFGRQWYWWSFYFIVMASCSLGCGDDNGDGNGDTDSCPAGSQNCPCTEEGECNRGLQCISGYCRYVTGDTQSGEETDTATGEASDTASGETDDGSDEDAGPTDTEEPTDTADTATETEEETGPPPDAPTLSRDSGTYNIATAFSCVTVNGVASGATVRYTLTTDGTEPAEPDTASSTLEEENIDICGVAQNGVTEIKVRQYSAGGRASEVSHYVYFLDTTAPVIASVTHETHVEECSERPIQFRLDTGGDVGAAAVTFNSTTLALYDDGTNGDKVAADGVYELTYVPTAADEVQETSVEGTFSDLAGNVAAPATAADLLTIVSLGNEVGGTTYTENVDWTPDNGPYVLSEDVETSADAALTIDEGTCVIFRGNARLWIRGPVQVLGTEADPVRVSGGTIAIFRRDEDDQELTYDEQSGAWVTGPRFEYVRAPRTEIRLHNLNADLVRTGAYILGSELDGLTAVFWDEWSSLTISAPLWGVYLKDSHVREISTEAQETRRYPVDLYHSMFFNSYIDFLNISNMTSSYTVRNCDIGALEIERFKDSALIEYNNFGTIEWTDPRSGPKINYSNFFTDPGEIAIRITDVSGSSQDVDATHNYWGPEATAQMDDLGPNANIDVIHDYYDDSALKAVLYDNWSRDPVPDAGPSW